ncbi:type I polyketide synthase [Streptomyces sp. NRRL S-920]|uniref:type I polyketide synthase n=1 Tax=Streptomyces sp. NRRL S-920 TaxID=1463921 RepID=UPI00068EA505|nr:type I polyketide synthase [Streptomyces sp. NRRL S-920]
MTEPAPRATDADATREPDTAMPGPDADSAIAIVGMSGRFPGAPDLDTYWANLRDGVCSIADFTRDELLADGTDPADLSRPEHVPAKGYLADADRFDTDLFGFNRTEAAALDPQHRLLLETAWAALEDAGQDPLAVPTRTGVYVGGSHTEHMLAAHTDRRLAASLGAMQTRILTDREFLAPWISYRLGLEGPSLTVQTACSTSLTAVHLAAQALLLGECDTALAGGVSVDTVRRQGYVHYEGGIFSPDGRCRPFDERAGGTVPGNGVGVVVLRRLSDALADGDPIRAVLRGSALTNDGATKVGFTAPGVEQQTAAIVEAWAAAGLAPSAAQYVETHGTATELGDRIELAAAKEAFAPATGTPDTGDRPRVGIGSVKSNIGHLDAAAGVASLIKTVLMLEHATLAPTVNLSRPHPELRLDATPFQVIDRPAPWPRPAEGPRLAGISSLGIGGTNVHVVLEESPDRPRPPAPADRHAANPASLTDAAAQANPATEILPLSARTETALTALAAKLATALRAPGAPSLADTAHTLRTARTPMDVRAYVLASDRAEAADSLTALAEGRPCTGQGEGPDADGLRELGELWLKGDSVPWPRSRDGARRVSLPTYPFEGESFGALTLPTATAAPGTEETTDPAGTGTSPDDLTPAVSAILAEALGLAENAPIAPETTYFSAGGDSLTAVHLVGRLRDDLGIDVPITLFLEELTLQELAVRIVEAKEPDAAEDSLDALLAEFEAEE